MTKRTCHVCARVGGHLVDCPMLAIDAQLFELAASLGLLVASVRETIDVIRQTLANLDTPA